MQEYLFYSGGKFKKGSHTLMVSNPFKRETFAKTYLADDSELEFAISKALEVREILRFMPSYEKYDILMEIAHALSDNEKYLAWILSMESAKPITLALSEIRRTQQTFIIAAEESKRIPKEYFSLDWTPAGEKREGMLKYFPIGLVAGISPFNFPLNLAAHKIAPAIATGCPIILKPSSLTPLSTLELAKIIDSTSLPKGAVSILPMDRETGNRLVTDDRIKLLSFTGSPAVGWKMKNNAAKKRVVLELGGNAGVIITPSADLDQAIQRCISGGFSYSGQVCIHTQRIYVHQSIFEEFTEKFVGKVSRLKYGNPLEETTDISVVINEESAIRIEKHINQAINKGAKLLCGGKKQYDYIEPTVVTGTDSTYSLNSEEIFGPVVAIEPYITFEQAVNLINDSEYGLQAGVFTNFLSEMDYAYQFLEVGGVIINDVPTFRIDNMPYGGVKGSGFGREGVKYAMLDMLETRLIVKNYISENID